MLLTCATQLHCLFLSSAEAMDVEQAPTEPTASGHVTSHEPKEPEQEWVGYLRSIETILGGKLTVSLHQEFLIRNNHTDLQILKNTKVYTCID